MHQHSEKFKFHHELQLLTAVKNLKERSDEGEKKLKEKDIEIEQLKELNTEKDETLNSLKNDIEALKSQLEDACKRLTEMERNKKQTNDLVNLTQQSKKVDKFEDDIDNLKTFAERISKLHYTLSEKCLRRNDHYYSTLLQEDYDEDEDVTQWNEMIKEVVENDNECEYLQTLKASMNQYKETIYSSTYEERLNNFCYFTPLGVYCYPLIRIGCSDHIESICVKIFEYYDDFEKDQKELERKDEIITGKVRNEFDVCSYYVGRCLHVAVALSCGKVFLLHKSNEEEKLELPNGKEVKIYILNYQVNYSFVLYYYD